VKPLTTEQRELAAQPRYLKLARMLAYRYARRCNQRAEDYVGPAMLGLVLAARAYDPARGVAFGTYAWERIVGSIRDHARQQIPRGYQRREKELAPLLVSLDEPMPRKLAQWKPRDLYEFVVSADEPVGWEVDSLDAVAGLVARLPPRQRKLLLLLYCGAGTCLLKAAGLALGFSESLACIEHGRALKTLRRKES
jgi:RNA polymerase sigma factor (sigma-70 family)